MMDPVLDNLLDVFMIVTFQPTAASTARDRCAKERFRSSDTVTVGDPRPVAGLGAEPNPAGLRAWFKFSFVPRL